MTYVALNFSGHVNGVAMRHGSVASQMFGGYDVDAITNGVHAATWVSPSMAGVFDRHIPSWRRDNFSLRYAVGIDAPRCGKRTSPPSCACSSASIALRVCRSSRRCSRSGSRGARPRKTRRSLVHDPARLRALAAQAGPTPGRLRGQGPSARRRGQAHHRTYLRRARGAAW